MQPTNKRSDENEQRARETISNLLKIFTVDQTDQVNKNSDAERMRLRDKALADEKKQAIVDFEILSIQAKDLVNKHDYSQAISKFDQAITIMQDYQAKHSSYLSNYAEISLASINESRRYAVEQQRLQVKMDEWITTRDEIYKASQLLLAARPSIANIPNYIQSMQKYKNIYAAHRDNFDSLGDDKGMEAQLIKSIAECDCAYKLYLEELKRQRIQQSDIDKQKQIYVLLDLVRHALGKDNVFEAFSILKTAKSISLAIIDPINIVRDQYTPPEFFEDSIEILNVEIARLNTIANGKSQEIAISAVREILLLVDKVNGEDCLYTEHLKQLRLVMQANLTKFWYKFDEREFPKDFAISVSSLIKDNIKPIGWSRYLEDWSKTMSIVSIKDPVAGKKQFPLLDYLLENAFEEYIPNTPWPRFIYLPIFPDRISVASNLETSRNGISAALAIPEISAYVDQLLNQVDENEIEENRSAPSINKLKLM